MPPKRPRHLDSDAARREFEARYGKEHGDLVWRETLGKVAREQAAESPRGVKIEKIPGHVSTSDRGTKFRVRSHEARVIAHPHSHGEHSGPCSTACRRGDVAHKHKRPLRGRY
ncbi:MAG: hypothetical protein ACREC5_08450 [Thermoplasmata archaeon]